MEYLAQRHPVPRIIPVYFAHRLTREESGGAAARDGAIDAETTAMP
ncbi:MAG: hypothetical protein JJE10_00300 [Thermoleophilia bacterium]|nr:hypothetical protein [Thermoleophilia bacterium]